MQNELHVLHTRTRDGKPLATVRNLPGLDADMTPAQMRALAHALLAAAKECELRAMDKRHFAQTQRRYHVTPNAPASNASHLFKKLRIPI